MRRESPVLPEERIERPALVWERPGRPPVEYGLWPERPVSIGREATNTIALDSAFVSKAHAMFQFTGGQWVIEDLKSANGTRVNGAPVALSAVSAGDVIEIGDQRLVFIDRAARGAAAPKAGLGKATRLAVAAVGTMAVMLTLLFLLIPKSPQPPARQAQQPQPPGQQRGTAPPASGATEATRLKVSADTDIVRDAVKRAEAAGVKVPDALFDDAIMQYQGGRLREASQLLAAALARQPTHALATRRFAEITAELEAAIASHSAEAERAFDELRYGDAMLEWEQVLQLAEPVDPRYVAAKTGLERTRAITAR